MFILVTSRFGITLTGLRDASLWRALTVEGADNLAVDKFTRQK